MIDEITGGSSLRATALRRLEQLREDQMAKGEKPRVMTGVAVTVTNIMPTMSHAWCALLTRGTVSVVYGDQIRGPIEDSAIRAGRSDHSSYRGSPTYNFCVVVDDWDYGNYP
ncbi:hypothetical protein KCP78_11775 [Salmonella enterica subsp. enterica]|nr:hypothetical protein KCP78_11775 [Salmonella enterica subsp. enterica]